MLLKYTPFDAELRGELFEASLLFVTRFILELLAKKTLKKLNNVKSVANWYNVLINKL